MRSYSNNTFVYIYINNELKYLLFAYTHTQIHREYISTSIHTYIHTYIHTAHTYIQHIHTYIQHIHTYSTYIHTYSTYIHTYERQYIQHIHTYIRTAIHTAHTYMQHIHTYIHTAHTYIQTYIPTGNVSLNNNAALPISRTIYLALKAQLKYILKNQRNTKIFIRSYSNNTFVYIYINNEMKYSLFAYTHTYI